MYAAWVTAFDSPPRYTQIREPVAGEHEEVVEVLAAGLHPRVRSQADGTHYTSEGDLPLVPGVDGVGRRADGSLVYFVLPDTTWGSMSERVAINPRRSIDLADDVDPVSVAAAMNPAMSSWLALTTRIHIQPGHNVMVLGATGSAGRLAVQIAQHLGAGTVTAVGRSEDSLALLPAFGADRVVSLAGDPAAVADALGRAGADVDIVLDYLWGPPTQEALVPIVTHRTDACRALDWIEVGSAAGPDISLSSALLRGANLRLLGSGQGSLDSRQILGSLPGLVGLISDGTLALEVEVVPLADVESAWTTSTTGGRRVVISP